MFFRRILPAVMLLSLCCAEPAAWARPRVQVQKAAGSHKTAKKKRIWTGLALIGAGAAVFATAGRSNYQPEQCALVPLATICTKATTVHTHNEAQQGIGAALVAAGGVLVWTGLQ